MIITIITIIIVKRILSRPSTTQSGNLERFTITLTTHVRKHAHARTHTHAPTHTHRGRHTVTKHSRVYPQGRLHTAVSAVKAHNSVSRSMTSPDGETGCGLLQSAAGHGIFELFVFSPPSIA